MFSIIVCSISPESAAKLHRNVAETIGVPFEFIALDNRNTGRGICSVYNECARRAKYDLLCFVHEDLLFKTQNWGEIIARQLVLPDCGVVGFAGGMMKLRTLSSWCVGWNDRRENYSDLDYRGKMTRHYTNPQNENFAQVVCLDGLCLMTSRRVWEHAPFDEDMLAGFHAYDLDFTTAAACNYKNYACCVVEVEHNSKGSYTRTWFNALQLYHEKWNTRLPLFVGEKPSERQIKHMELKTQMRMIHKLLFLRVVDRITARRMVLENIFKYPTSGHAWMLIYKYVRYYSFSS